MIARVRRALGALDLRDVCVVVGLALIFIGVYRLTTLPIFLIVVGSALALSAFVWRG